MSFDFHADLTMLLPQMRAFARALTRDFDAADDLVQEAVLRALRARNQFQAGTNFRAWLFTIVRNLFISTMRRRRFVGPSLDDGDAPEFGRAADQEDVVMLIHLRRAMERIPAEQAEALMLVGALGVSYEEAAVICNCAIGTIKSRVSRGRQALLVALHPPCLLPFPTAAQRRGMDWPIEQRAA